MRSRLAGALRKGQVPRAYSSETTIVIVDEVHGPVPCAIFDFGNGSQKNAAEPHTIAVVNPSGVCAAPRHERLRDNRLPLVKRTSA
jgi:hypothetical protein